MQLHKIVLVKSSYASNYNLIIGMINILATSKLNLTRLAVNWKYIWKGQMLKNNLQKCFFICTSFLLLISNSVYSKLPEPHFTTSQELTSLAVPRLSAETYQRGIFFHHLQQSHGLNGLDDTLGGGVCVFDLDSDGDMDIYFVSGSGATRYFGKQHWWSNQARGQLYRNDGDGYFELITNDTGLPLNIWGMGCNSGDLDNDGIEDLVITTRHENWISYGNGDATFETIQLGTTNFWSTAVGLRDINGDGYLDIYIGNYINFEKNAKKLEINSGFSGNKSSFKSENFSAQANELYINLGARKFANSAVLYGVDNPDGRTLGIKWMHGNKDSWIDLLVMNDRGSEPQLYLNKKGMNFERAPLAKQIDSLNGLRSSTLLSSSNARDKAVSVFGSEIGKPIYLLDMETNNNLTWQVVRGSDKLESFSAWGMASSDYNGDGLVDLYIATGLLEPDDDAILMSKGQPDLILLQDKYGKLHKRLDESGVNLSTRSVSSADFDNDGDVDLILTNNNAPAQLKINYSNPKYWIGFDVRDKLDHKNTYLAIKVIQPEKAIWLHPFDDGFLGNQDYRNIATLNDDDDLIVEVFWNDGSASRYENLRPGHYYQLEQSHSEEQLSYSSEFSVDPLPIDLAIWQIKSDQVQWRRIISTFRGESVENRKKLLHEGYKYKKQALVLAFSELLLGEGSYSQYIVESLWGLELEISLPLVLKMVEENLDCAIANMIRSWLKEEEAMILGKRTFISPLVKKLPNLNPVVQECVLYALAESRQYRPVVEIEKLLVKSGEISVKKAAIYSLGRLRRSQSIPLIKSFLNNSDLVEEAQNALANFDQHSRSSVKPVKAVVSTSSDDQSKSVFKTFSSCPRVNAEKALSLKPPEIANLFNLCSKISLRYWMVVNKAILVDSIEVLLTNRHLSSDNLALLLEVVGDLDVEGLELILLGVFDKAHAISKKLVILSALKNYKNNEFVQNIATDILVNSTYPKALRIAAGNILIDVNPALVMNYSESIFNEK